MPKVVVISVVGTHAGETLDNIFKRKKKEIEKVGHALWLYKSHSAKPDVIQKLAKFGKNDLECFFISASSKSGARPTKEQHISGYFSVNKKRWQLMPKGTLVTGSSKSAFALVLKRIDLINRDIDLWNYSSFVDPHKSINIRLGDSTLPAIKRSSATSPRKMKNHIRRVIAVGKLKSPFSVWLKV